MYTPRHFANTDQDACIALMRANSFATLVSHINGELEATHAPMIIEPQDIQVENSTLNIAFHLARNNPICADLDAGKRTLIIFTGEHNYISPDWYANENLVPTWNYTAVHATGQPQTMSDKELVEFLEVLSANNERTLDKTPWTPASVDETMYAQMRKSIVGYRMPVQTLTGKAKLNQNRSKEDRLGAIQGLRQLADGQGDALADLMQRSLASKG